MENSIANLSALNRLAKILNKTPELLYEDICSTAEAAIRAAGPGANTASFQYAGRDFAISGGFNRNPLKVDLIGIDGSRQRLAYLFIAPPNLRKGLPGGEVV